MRSKQAMLIHVVRYRWEVYWSCLITDDCPGRSSSPILRRSLEPRNGVFSMIASSLWGFLSVIPTDDVILWSCDDVILWRVKGPFSWINDIPVDRTFVCWSKTASNWCQSTSRRFKYDETPKFQIFWPITNWYYPIPSTCKALVHPMESFQLLSICTYIFIRSRLSIALVRSSSRCLRAERTPTHRFHIPMWDSGTGLGLYRM